MSTPEFSRPVSLRQIDSRPVTIEANEAERAALSRRFDIAGIERLVATLDLVRDGTKVRISGAMQATIDQICSVSGEEFRHSLEDDVALVFVPALPRSSDQQEVEIELEREELDEIEYEGDAIDIGEAVAQTLALAIDPYAEGPDADAARKRAGITGDDAPSGALAEALAALKKN